MVSTRVVSAAPQRLSRTLACCQEPTSMRSSVLMATTRAPPTARDHVAFVPMRSASAVRFSWLPCAMCAPPAVSGANIARHAVGAAE
jgi:hypothetical protein